MTVSSRISCCLQQPPHLPTPRLAVHLHPSPPQTLQRRPVPLPHPLPPLPLYHTLRHRLHRQSLHSSTLPPKKICPPQPQKKCGTRTLIAIAQPGHPLDKDWRAAGLGLVLGVVPSQALRPSKSATFSRCIHPVTRKCFVINECYCR